MSVLHILAQTRQAAVIDFQSLYGIKVDGIAGQETIEAINEAIKGNRRKVAPKASRGSSRNTSRREDCSNCKNT